MRMVRRCGATFLGAVVGSLIAYLLAVRPRLLRWGASPEEVDREMPGDDLVRWPDISTTRAITIAARPDEVWPWLVQIGYRRGGFYSYDRLEEMAGLRGIVSADRIVPEWQGLAIGDKVLIGPETLMDVVVCDPGRALVLHVAMDPLIARVVDPGSARRFLDWTWSFSLEPVDTSATRLVVRVRGAFEPRWLAPLFYSLVEPAHFIMERKMLQGIKLRAETSATTRDKMEG